MPRRVCIRHLCDARRALCARLSLQPLEATIYGFGLSMQKACPPSFLLNWDRKLSTLRKIPVPKVIFIWIYSDSLNKIPMLPLSKEDIVWKQQWTNLSPLVFFGHTWSDLVLAVLGVHWAQLQHKCFCLLLELSADGVTFCLMIFRQISIYF